ncbi:MAG: hypothetical protein U0359_16460 [Byssovorax sp.]
MTTSQPISLLTHGDGPVFEVAVQSTELRLELRVNDVPVLRLKGGHAKTVFDVNPQVVKGENSLTMIVRPLERGQEFSRHAVATASFRRRASVKDEKSERLAALVFEGPGANAATGFEKSPGYATVTPPVLTPMGLRATQAFDLDAPFEPWSFMTAPPITVTESVRSELFTAIRRVHALMKAKDIAGLTRECEHQTRDWQQAYYLPDEASAVKMLGVPQTFADPDVEVEDLPDGHFEVELLGGGRLIQLVDENGDSPLRLRVRDVPSMVGRFVCVFCRTAGGFRIAR